MTSCSALRAAADAPRRWLLPAAAGAILALPGVVALWGFTVDDALISARYAAHLAAGHGYRFNPGGPLTDGVTPLGWAHLLSLWAGGGPVAAWRAAKVLGAAAWLLGAGLVGVGVGRAGDRRARWAALALVGSSASLPAWSVAGMETGLVLLLGCVVALARVLERDRVVAACAGLMAAWRPELSPFAGMLALFPARAEGERALPAQLLLIPIVLAPPAVVAASRLYVFGTVVPLSVVAKPSDLGHGLSYTLSCVVFAGVVSVVAVRALPRWCRGAQAAIAVHLLAMTAAGGDWMPLSRLLVPVAPLMVVVAAAVVDRAHLAIGLPRLGLAVAGQLVVMLRVGPAAAAVGPARLALIQEHAPLLAGAHCVATVDAGWVGAATGAAVLDLAGVTDPAVAVLGGGHTSKRIPDALLPSRHVDAVVLLLAPGAQVQEPWTESRFSRVVEQRVAWLPAMDRQMGVVHVSDAPLRYVLLRPRLAP